MNSIVACIDCRNAFEAGPTNCPNCNASTFVYLNMNENVDDVCEELLVFAAFARLGSDEVPAPTPAMSEKVAISRDRFQTQETVELSIR